MTSENENVRATPVGSVHGATWHGEYWVDQQAWQTVTNKAGEPIAYASEEAALAGAKLCLPVKKPKREKPKSRPERWGEAATEAANALSEMEEALTKFTSAMEDLRGVQEEYEEAKDNMPENLQSSPYGEKLNTICDISIEGAADSIQSAIDEARGVIDEAENAEFPLGFGRD